MFRKILFMSLLFVFSNAATLTDVLDRKVEVKDGVEKVVLTFYFEEYFVTTGEEGVSKIAGWSKGYWKGRREATWQAFLKKFPSIDQIPDVGYVGKNTLSFERIVSLKPDVVLFAKNDYEKVKQNLKNLDSSGIAAVFVDFHDENLQNHMKSMEILGEIFGKQDRIAEVNKFYKSKFELVEQRLAKAKNTTKPKVYVEFSEKAGASVFGVSYDDKMWGAFVSAAGGENIAKGLIKGASSPLNPEFIVNKNPDIIIFAGNYFPNGGKNIPLGYGVSKQEAAANFNDYAQRSGWQNINAVKNHKIYAIYHDLSRHIFDFEGILFFAKKIHPELFADIDPTAELKEFFDKFYRVEFSGTWMIDF